MSVDHLRRAREEKNDEFYTRYEDVEKELAHYPDAFRGKVVYCNADDPHWSAFPRFFLKNFRRLGLCRLISTCYNGEAGEGETPDMFAEPTGRTAWKLDVTDCDGEEIENFVKAHVEKLNGNGDFRSRECLALLRESDIVCTNPPFSLIRGYFSYLVREKKDLLIIGPSSALTARNVFLEIMSGKVSAEGWYECEFDPPVPTIWLTTLKSDRVRVPRIFTKHYRSEEYPRYENYDAIEVGRSENIPCDYDGVMGVPISFMEWYCPDQFEIVGATAVTGEGARLNGGELFARVFIRKKSATALPCQTLFTRVREQYGDDELGLF